MKRLTVPATKFPPRIFSPNHRFTRGHLRPYRDRVTFFEGPLRNHVGFHAECGRDVVTQKGGHLLALRKYMTALLYIPAERHILAVQLEAAAES